jgi:hypothetical protein
LGVDTFWGGIGNDLLDTRDLATDGRIDCEGGTDRADLDLLPRDPNHLVKGCETKARH